MKLLKILSKIGKGIVKEVLPGSNIIEAVSSVLSTPIDDKSTGHDILEKIGELPESEQSKLLALEFDIELEQLKQEHETVRAMFHADTVQKHTTRPKVILFSFYIFAACTIAIVAGWLFAVLTGNSEMVKSIQEGSLWVAAMLSPVVIWVNRYFGILRDEERTRLEAHQNALQPKNTALHTIAKRIIGG